MVITARNQREKRGFVVHQVWRLGELRFLSVLGETFQVLKTWKVWSGNLYKLVISIGSLKILITIYLFHIQATIVSINIITAPVAQIEKAVFILSMSRKLMKGFPRLHEKRKNEF